jgi:hypothetical protein
MPRISYKKLYEQLLKEHEKTLELLKKVSSPEEVCVSLIKQSPSACKEMTPYNTFIDTISTQTQKEAESNIWGNSDFRELPKLQANNAGIVGEHFIQKICEKTNIESTVNGTKTKKIGGGNGDGLIKDKIVEIKTSHRGNGSPSFQHELGEKPWISDYMVFVDADPSSIYLTIFENFTEDHYKSGNKCVPIYPTKSITQRKGIGAFKLDTTININEECVKGGYTIKIDKDTSFRDLKKFINNRIK